MENSSRLTTSELHVYRVQEVLEYHFTSIKAVKTETSTLVAMDLPLVV